MTKFETNLTGMENDLLETVRAFSLCDYDLTVRGNEVDGKFFVVINLNGFVLRDDFDLSYSSDVERKRLVKRYVKLSLYKALSQVCIKTLPWGALFGIRPVKLYKSVMNDEGVEPFRYFKDFLCVSDEKAKLTKSIYELQSKLYNRDRQAVDVYVGIPFCLSRCYYCTFVSEILSKCDKTLLGEYISSLRRDIESAGQLIKTKKLTIRSIYVGGGTPTSISDEQFENVISALSELNKYSVEFTVEAGRPDTITAKKLDIMKKYGVTRISVNPQTTSDKTLEIIGRKHTAEEFFEKYKLARNYSFEINCDLIAGLKGDTFDTFVNSLGDVIGLAPDNITIHSLSVKAGAKLKVDGDKVDGELVQKMFDFAYKRLAETEYAPYYLYRQKYTGGGLENTGFALPNTECLYNVDIMEENVPIIACGSDGISKCDDANGKLVRFAHPKDIRTYVEKLETNIETRFKLFSNE